MNSIDMQKVTYRCLNRCSKEDIAFKLYIQRAIEYIIETNYNFLCWENDINDLIYKLWKLKVQVGEFTKNTNVEDINYMKDIKNYLEKLK